MIIVQDRLSASAHLIYSRLKLLSGLSRFQLSLDGDGPPRVHNLFVRLECNIHLLCTVWCGHQMQSM